MSSGVDEQDPVALPLDEQDPDRSSRLGLDEQDPVEGRMKRMLEICPRGNNKLVIIIFPCS